MRRRRRRRALAVLAVVVVLSLALVLVGRFERTRALDHALNGIDHVRSLVDGARPSAYRITPNVYCLLYRRGRDAFALELCYDHQGRLIEAIDRRTLSPVFWDVSYEPAAARAHLAPQKLAATLSEMHAFKLLKIPPGVLPSGLQDLGPSLRGVPYGHT
jgi:hypothetical protein